MRAVHNEPLCLDLTHDDVLRHYLRSAQQTVQSIDQLGNFLMGFGVLALGYLLQQDLGAVAGALSLGGPSAPSASLSGPSTQLAAALTLLAWGIAVGLLVCFVHAYVFRVIAGRAVHGKDGAEDGIGEVLDLPDDLAFDSFVRPQRTFERFLKTSFRTRDQGDPEALLYSRWTYLRFMMLKKLSEMQRMRHLLGLALLFGVAFKVLLTYYTALSG